MKVRLRRYSPAAWIRRLRRGPPPATTLTVHDRAVDCPNGETTVEHCMQCDRLILLHVDQSWNGTVECTPDSPASSVSS